MAKGGAATKPPIINKRYVPDVPAGDLLTHPENPRRGDVESIRESIRVNGFYGALIVQESTGFILVGNHRYRAGVEEGIDAFPVMYVEVDDVEAKRLALVDNRTNDLSEYDVEALSRWVEEVAASGVGLEGSGFDEDARRELLQRTGAAAANATEFLSGYRDKATEEERPAAAEAAGSWFSLAYTVSAAERAEVVEALRAVREDKKLDTATEGLLWLCRDYMRRDEA